MLPKKIADILFIVLAGIYVFTVNYKPAANWDILPYMALTLQHNHNDQGNIHSRVYQLVKKAQDDNEIKPGAYSELITERIPYRTKCHEDYEYFFNQLSYYRAKPLYIVTVTALYNSGISLVHATVIPSAVAAFLILLITYCWLLPHTGRLLAAIFAAAIILLPAFSLLQNYSSPDAMSNMVVLLSIFMLAEQKSRKLLFIILSLAILIRIDNFVFASVVLFFLYAKTRKQIAYTALVSTVLTFIAVIILPYLLGNTTYWFSEFKFLESHVQYYFHVRNVFRDFLGVIDYQLWVTVGVLCLLFTKAHIRKLAILIIVTCIIRLILFPSLQERFFVAYELALAVLLLISIVKRIKNKPLHATVA